MPRPCSRPEESIAPRWSQKAIQCAIGKGFVSSANSTFCVGNLLQLHQEQKKEKLSFNAHTFGCRFQHDTSRKQKMLLDFS